MISAHQTGRVRTSVVQRLPKPRRRVRLPYPAPLRNDLWLSGDRASAFISTAKVFLRSNPQSLRWIASLFLIKPSLTCSVAPSLQNANILLVCILVFLPTLENSRTPCLFVHFTKGRVSVFDVQHFLIRRCYEACFFDCFSIRQQYAGNDYVKFKYRAKYVSHFRTSFGTEIP